MRILIILITFVLVLLTNVKVANAANVAKVIFSPSGQIAAGKNVRVEVFIDSNVQVNAAQISITYPTNEISLQSVDTVNSKFTIKAEETITPGVVKIARGNVQALRGKNLLASLNVIPQTTNSLSKLSYSVSDSLVMSKDNVNVLSGSQVLTVKPVTPAPVKGTKSLTTYFSEAVKEFFKGIFGR